MTRDEFRFFHRLRVRWAEVDMQKIVFNAHYLMYFDTAVADYWRALALPYEQAMHQLGGDLYVKKATVEFNASARVDDQLEVALKCARIGNSSIAFDGAIFRGNDLLVTCELVYVFADPATQTSRPVPAPLRAILTGYEAGEAMLEVKTGDWTALGPDAAQVRTEVFLREQRIPEALEWDDKDAVALHAVAYNRLGMPLATGRLIDLGQGTSRIGRVAVHRALRGCGVGEQVMRTLAAHAAECGQSRVDLSAQVSAMPFYARLGFAPEGEVYDDAGIAHRQMSAALPLAR